MLILPLLLDYKQGCIGWRDNREIQLEDEYLPKRRAWEENIQEVAYQVPKARI